MRLKLSSYNPLLTEEKVFWIPLPDLISPPLVLRSVENHVEQGKEGERRKKKNGGIGVKVNFEASNSMHAKRYVCRGSRLSQVGSVKADMQRKPKMNNGETEHSTEQTQSDLSQINP